MDLRPLATYLPENTSLELFQHWLEREEFALQLKKPRASKLGDFRPPQKGQKPTITLNSNLKPYQFLTTLVHEIAHLKTWNTYGRKAAPHGVEWKSCFAQMLIELSRDPALHPNYKEAILRHSQRPKSNTGADMNLQKVILGLDEVNPVALLGELGPEDEFVFRNRRFKYLGKRRTRALVEELSTGRQFTIPLVAQIEPC